MRITSLVGDLTPLYPGGRFDPGCWEAFMRAADPALAELCLADMNGDKEFAEDIRTRFNALLDIEE